MTLEAQVASLTTQTTALLEAVTVQKSYIDAATQISVSGITGNSGSSVPAIGKSPVGDNTGKFSAAWLLPSPEFSTGIALTGGASTSAFIEVAGNGNAAGTGSAFFGQDGANTAYSWNRANAALSFGTNSAERGRFSAAGNFILGSTVDNGIDKLQVAGTVSAARIGLGGPAITDAMLTFTASGTNGGTPGAVTGFCLYEGGSTRYGISTNSNGGMEISANQTGQGIRFYTGSANTSPTERMQIAGSGHVLVGTSTDDGNNKLQVAGGVVVSAGTTGAASHMAMTWDSSGGNIQSYLNKPLLLNPLGNRVLIGKTVDRGVDTLQIHGSLEIGNQINCYTGADLEVVQRSGGNIVLYTGSVVPSATLSPAGLSLPNGFGCNGSAPQGKYAVNAACSDLATAIALINQLRAALVASGIVF